MKIKHVAQYFVKESGFNSASSSIKVLENWLKKRNIGLHWYSDKDSIIDSLQLSNMSDNAVAFTVFTEKFKCIFVSAKIQSNVAHYLILHEIGHILLCHVRQDTASNYTEQQEIEAEQFVHLVQQDKKVTKLALWLSIGICLISIVMSSAITYNYCFNSNSVSTSTSVHLSTAPRAEQVYITKNGTKYHKENCYHIENSEIIELVIADAEVAGYEPCKYCFN